LAYLEVRTTDSPTETVPLRKGVVTMGRAPQNDLVMRDKISSRVHSRIVKTAFGHKVVDLGSSNGTFVNNRKVAKEQALKDGDVIKIGNTQLIYRVEPEGAIMPGAGQSEIFATQIVKSAHEVSAAMGTTGSLAEAKKIPTGRLSENLYILYRIGKMLTSARNVDELLHTAMDLIFKVLKADRGLLMLVDPGTGKLTPKVSRSRTGTNAEIEVSSTISSKVIEEKVSILTSDATADPRFSDGRSIALQNIRSALCVPLWEEGQQVRGIIYIDNTHEPNVFGESDLDLLTAVANQIAVALIKEELNEQIRKEAVIRNSLERYNSRQVVNMIIKQIESGGRVALEMKETTASALFADLQNFTPLCERLPPQDVAELLSTYFDHMARIVFANNGMINKYVGDAILAVFGAFSQDDGAEGATLAAIQMVEALGNLKEKDQRFEDFNVRIGVNTGIMVCGNIGPLERIEYTVLGDPVNVASRLQSLAEPNSALIGENTFESLKTELDAVCLGQTALKGKQQKIRVYRVC
jgi:adenylate cyclase